jgi:hypothetical protein
LKKKGKGRAKLHTLLNQSKKGESAQEMLVCSEKAAKSCAAFEPTEEKGAQICTPLGTLFPRKSDYSR